MKSCHRQRRMSVVISLQGVAASVEHATHEVRKQGVEVTYAVSTPSTNAHVLLHYAIRRAMADTDRLVVAVICSTSTEDSEVGKKRRCGESVDCQTAYCILQTITEPSADSP
jgi:hypothetical protein